MTVDESTIHILAQMRSNIGTSLWMQMPLNELASQIVTIRGIVAAQLWIHQLQDALLDLPR